MLKRGWIISLPGITQTCTEGSRALIERMRLNLNERNDIILRFHLVQELQMFNALTASMLEDPKSINWGLNEVALLKVIEDGASKPDKTSAMPFNRLAFLWEGERRIEILFVELEVLCSQSMTSE